MERRRKREEERRRRIREEEERRRKEEEERRREEEEFERKLAETEANKPKYNGRQQYQEEDPYGSYSSPHHKDSTYRRYSPEEQYQPTPPPKPKPVRVQKRPPPKQSAQVKRTPSPQFTTNDISMYENASKDDDAYAEGKIKLIPCSNCGRKFAADRLQRHKNACGNLTKKRKVMDPTKMRVAGTEMEKYTESRHRSRTPPVSHFYYIPYIS